MDDSAEKKKTAAYISFSTFLSALDAVASVGVPNIIDRHSFPNRSGGVVAAVLSSFRFFELIDDQGHPQPFLHDLAIDKDARQKNIRSLLEKHYDSVIAIDLLRATPPQLEAAFGHAKYSVSGATKRKAQAFFLKAAAFADIPVGKLLLSKSRNSGPRKPRKAKDAGSSNIKPSMRITSDPSGSAATKIVQLTSGGAIMLTASVDVLSLTGVDRDFVFKIIDLLNDFESGKV